MNPLTRFETQVLADLSTLKAEMRALVGNGQPGRLHELEARVEKHQIWIERATGLALILAPLLAAIHIAVDYFRGH